MKKLRLVVCDRNPRAEEATSEQLASPNWQLEAKVNLSRWMVLRNHTKGDLRPPYVFSHMYAHTPTCMYTYK